MTDQHDRAPDQPLERDAGAAQTTQATQPTQPIQPTEPDAETTMPPSATDEGGPPGEPVGNDNIRDGTVRGIMGGPHQSQGQGQGG